jgi:hypothetical protein
MNTLNIEQAVAALVNHYVAASAGLVSENVQESYGYQSIAFLFASRAERDTNLPTGNFVKAGKRSTKSRKKTLWSNEAAVADRMNASEPQNAFFNFAREKMSTVSQEVASASASGNSQVSIAQKLNEMWAALSDDAKCKFSSEYVTNLL